MVAWRFHPNGGGVERHVMEVSRCLMARGHQVTIVTEAYLQDLPLEEILDLAEGPLRVLRIPPLAPHFAGYLRLAWWREWNRAEAAFREASVIHFHDYSPLLYWFMPVWWLFLAKRVFLTFHGWEGLFPPSPRVIRLRQWVGRMVQGTIAIGSFIDRWYGTKSSAVSYGGVTAVSHPTEHTEGTGMVFLGRLASDTGAEDCIVTLAQLRDLGLDLPLKVCGDGPLRQQLEDRARLLGIEAQFLGWVVDPAPILSDASIVFCSGYLGILESLAKGRLVCATYDNTLKEDYLRMMPPAASSLIIEESPARLASRLAELLAHSTRLCALIGEGQAWALDQTWDQVADVYEELWRQG